MIEFELPSALFTVSSTHMSYENKHVKFWCSLAPEVVSWMNENSAGTTQLYASIHTSDDVFPMVNSPRQSGISELMGEMAHIGARLRFESDADAIHFKMKWLAQ